MSIPILKIFTLFFCVFQMLQNTVRLFWQTRHTFLVALAKIHDYETPNENSVGKFVSNPSTDEDRYTGREKQKSK